MIIEAWVQMAITDLDPLWSQAKGENPPTVLKPLTNGVRGFWRSIAPNEIVNIIGEYDEIVLFYNTYQADIISMDSWYQGPAFDAIEPDLPLTDPSRILSFMPDFIDYDENGDPIGSTPPTFENPNWAHSFFGQGTRVVAGEFDVTEFSEDFF